MSWTHYQSFVGVGHQTWGSAPQHWFQGVKIYLSFWTSTWQLGTCPPPVNFYLQFKAAHVQNLKHHGSMQGWHLFPSFQMPTGWVELLFIDAFCLLPAYSPVSSLSTKLWISSVIWKDLVEWSLAQWYRISAGNCTGFPHTDPQETWFLLLSDQGRGVPPATGAPSENRSYPVWTPFAFAATVRASSWLVWW